MTADIRPGRARGALLLYGMYDMRALDTAPQVRISMMSEALEGLVPLERIIGGRTARAWAAARWLLAGRWRSADAVYVESSTSTPTPADLAFLGLMRLLRRPVGVYFRDAYQLFRDVYPRSRRRHVVLDVMWRLTLPLLRGLATQRFVQSDRLGRALGLGSVILLPPGTDPGTPNLGAGRAPIVAYVGGLAWADGFDRLIEAMRITREQVPEARLLVIGPPLPADRAASLPDWVELRRAGRTDLPDLLRDVRLCTIPRPIMPYTDMVIPVKLWDYLSLGKPIVATATVETSRVIERSQAGLVTGDEPGQMAEAFVALLLDEVRARRLGENARSFAESPDVTWRARAETVVASLGVGPGRG